MWPYRTGRLCQDTGQLANQERSHRFELLGVEAVEFFGREGERDHYLGGDQAIATGGLTGERARVGEDRVEIRTAPGPVQNVQGETEKLHFQAKLDSGALKLVIGTDGCVGGYFAGGGHRVKC